MTTLPVHNPIVPFSSYIPGGVNVGTRLFIRGMVPFSGTRFSIDLQCGSQWTQDDIAFHLSVRPSEYSIVRNSFEYYNWGPEEHGGTSTVSRGNPYDIEIIAGQNAFSVRVNGAHFCQFQHRIPMHRISHIRISGDTMLYYVGQDYQTYTGYPAGPACPPIIVSSATPVVITQRTSGGTPMIGAALAGGIIGATVASTARPGYFYRRPFWGLRHHHRHRWF